MRGMSTRVASHAERQGDSWTVTGLKNPVLAGDCADVVVVSATRPDGRVGLSSWPPMPRADVHSGRSTGSAPLS